MHRESRQEVKKDMPWRILGATIAFALLQIIREE